MELGGVQLRIHATWGVLGYQEANVRWDVRLLGPSTRDAAVRSIIQPKKAAKMPGDDILM
ncbi:hypothetical protein ACLOJK_000250, partial [Asimina triloba]